MKRLLIIFSILSVSAHGEVWGPQDLKFKLEDRSNIEAMIWLSGFSYSSTALYKSCGAIGSKESISSKLFVDLLNSKYTGATISAEQATAHISSYLGKEYVCKNI